MSHTELDRVSVIRAIISRQLTQAQAAQRLQLSVRQVKRLTRAYRTGGAAAGIVSKHRGRCPGNALSDALRQRALALIRAHYIDFGPTFAQEKLTALHACHCSVETLRKWMLEEGLWRGKQRKKAAIHQSRPRRPRLGELVQIDGSPHDWFEGRGPRCTLMVFIDDATSRLLALRFAPTKTTQAYRETLAQQLDKHGRPVAIYSDKHSIFRVNHPDKEGELTQFTRALKTLDIEPIHAHTPQAKGRVERANKTRQDRLVKEMRLRNIRSIEQANAFLPQFIDDYNRRFAVPAHHPDNAHREVLHNAEALTLILCRHHRRKLSKNLTIAFRNTEYQLQGYGKGYRRRGATITVCEDFNGAVTLLHQGKALAYRLFQE